MWKRSVILNLDITIDVCWMSSVSSYRLKWFKKTSKLLDVVWNIDTFKRILF